MAAIPIRVGSTIRDEIEKVYDDITRRAYERFLARGGSYTLDMEDWLAAERTLLRKPDARVVEKQELFVVRVNLDLIDPATVDVLATADDVLIQSNESSGLPRIFRAVHFPLPVDPRQIHATYARGMLILIAPKVSHEAGIRTIQNA
jgi:HSP20 family molecular chaperone IbpA